MTIEIGTVRGVVADGDAICAAIRSQRALRYWHWIVFWLTSGTMLAIVIGLAVVGRVATVALLVLLALALAMLLTAIAWIADDHTTLARLHEDLAGIELRRDP